MLKNGKFQVRPKILSQKDEQRVILLKNGILPWLKDIQIGIKVETEWVRWLRRLAAKPEDLSSSSRIHTSTR